MILVMYGQNPLFHLPGMRWKFCVASGASKYGFGVSLYYDTRNPSDFPVTKLEGISLPRPCSPYIPCLR